MGECCHRWGHGLNVRNPSIAQVLGVATCATEMICKCHCIYPVGHVAAFLSDRCAALLLLFSIHSPPIYSLMLCIQGTRLCTYSNFIHSPLTILKCVLPGHLLERVAKWSCLKTENRFFFLKNAVFCFFKVAKLNVNAYRHIDRYIQTQIQVLSH